MICRNKAWNPILSAVDHHEMKSLSDLCCWRLGISLAVEQLSLTPWRKGSLLAVTLQLCCLIKDKVPTGNGCLLATVLEHRLTEKPKVKNFQVVVLGESMDLCTGFVANVPLFPRLPLALLPSNGWRGVPITLFVRQSLYFLSRSVIELFLMRIDWSRHGS